MAAIPRTHFSVLQELTYGLIAPMEADGYTLPEYLVPDISQARMFSKWLRHQKCIDPSTFPTYLHRYEDGGLSKPDCIRMSCWPTFEHTFRTFGFLSGRKRILPKEIFGHCRICLSSWRLQ